MTSLSVTGLQELIDTANSYIAEHGLKFNPTKTICTTLGCRNFEDTPQWDLNNTILREKAAVTYLGTVLLNSTKHHIDTRIKAAHMAFHGLQSTGLCANDVSPIVSAHMLSVAIQHILSYGCSTLNANRNIIKELDKAQAKLLKSALGLLKFFSQHSTVRSTSIKKDCQNITSTTTITVKKRHH